MTHSALSIYILMNASNDYAAIHQFIIKKHPFIHSSMLSINLDRWVGSCNTLDDLSNRVYVLNKTEDFNLSIFNMITGISLS